MIAAERLCETEALGLLAGVGGEREWWFYSPARVGHLRVNLTVAEAAALAPGVAVHDAGETGPERRRQGLLRLRGGAR